MKILEENLKVITANFQTPLSLNCGLPTQKRTDIMVRMSQLYLMVMLLLEDSGKLWISALVLPRHMMMLKTVNQTLLLIMVSLCTIVMFKSKIKLYQDWRCVLQIGIPMISMQENHEMPLLLPQFKKLKRDSNGHMNGQRCLNLLKQIGVSWELIFQNNTVEVFSLIVLKTEIPEPWLESVQIQSNTSIIKHFRLWLQIQDTSASLNMSNISIFSWNNSMITISWETFFQWKFSLLEPIMNKRISMMFKMRLHLNFSANLLISSWPYFLLISVTFDSRNSCVIEER